MALTLSGRWPSPVVTFLAKPRSSLCSTCVLASVKWCLLQQIGSLWSGVCSLKVTLWQQLTGEPRWKRKMMTSHENWRRPKGADQVSQTPFWAWFDWRVGTLTCLGGSSVSNVGWQPTKIPQVGAMYEAWSGTHGHSQWLNVESAKSVSKLKSWQTPIRTCISNTPSKALSSVGPGTPGGLLGDGKVDAHPFGGLLKFSNFGPQKSQHRTDPTCWHGVVQEADQGYPRWYQASKRAANDLDDDDLGPTMCFAHGIHRKQLRFEAVNSIAKKQQAESSQASRASSSQSVTSPQASANAFWKKAATEALALSREQPAKRDPPGRTGETLDKNKSRQSSSCALCTGSQVATIQKKCRKRLTTWVCGKQAWGANTKSGTFQEKHAKQKLARHNTRLYGKRSERPWVLAVAALAKGLWGG